MKILKEILKTLREPCAPLPDISEAISELALLRSELFAPVEVQVLLRHNIPGTIVELLLNEHIRSNQEEISSIQRFPLQEKTLSGCIGVVSYYRSEKLIQREYLYTQPSDFDSVRLVCHSVGAIVLRRWPYCPQNFSQSHYSCDAVLD